VLDPPACLRVRARGQEERLNPYNDPLSVLQGLLVVLLCAGLFVVVLLVALGLARLF
jgi:hypothetical protein